MELLHPINQITFKLSEEGVLSYVYYFRKGFLVFVLSNMIMMLRRQYTFS